MRDWRFESQAVGEVEIAARGGREGFESGKDAGSCDEEDHCICILL